MLDDVVTPSSSPSLAARVGRGVPAALRGLGRAAVDLVLPPVCAGCRTAVAEPGCLCGACWSGLDFIERPYCERLGIPFAFDPGGARLSAEALADPPAYDRARAAVLYGGIGRDLVHGLKYNDRTETARLLARMMSRAGAELLAGADALVPVPLHRLRLWRRRFNQSAALALGIARESSVAFRPEWLERRRPTAPQFGLDRSARANNVAGAFAVPEAMRAELAGRRIVLVDDVLTTGATMDACCKALLRAGAAGVDVLVFARVVDGRSAPISLS
ncbi:ComF family protein [Bosea sp. 117]|uniref:ComF family protein n=1 Tax=Bosea sp. 117 TaxID=1125973 RepID=UPI0004941243|nr:ComF family protein [Bosea sp. 117]